MRACDEQRNWHSNISVKTCEKYEKCQCEKCSFVYFTVDVLSLVVVLQDPVIQDDLKDQHKNVDKLGKKLVRQGSVSENFFAVKNASLILPKNTSSGEPVEGMKKMKFGGDLKTHLYAIIGIVRPQDKVKLVARLESWDEERMRYLVIVATIGRQDTEESIILGIDFEKNEHEKCTIGLTIPIWSDMTIQLDGDGGFKVTGRESTYSFKPVSVQAMWSALQAVHHCIDVARQNNYYFGSLYLTWTCYYESRVTSCRLFLNEWEYCEKVWSRRANFYSNPDPQRERIELKIRGNLKEVMMKMDLDNCNSRDIRQALERDTDLDLGEYKEYIDTEMLTILGQMDTASEILDFLYLGSEWNASNMEELTQNGISHILNITMEIDNFFPDGFTYKNIRCYDEETTDLLHVWNDTYKFINQARRSNGKCLVHCKMGISRSAATVTAFVMKENQWPMEKALSFVRKRRPIVLPNEGFMLQLQEYEGILNASAQRHNLLFRSLSESNLSAEHVPDKEEVENDHTSLRLTYNQPQIDFHRRLLDLTSLVYRPSHKRCKSWSPGDTKLYDPDDFTSLDFHEEASSMNTAPLSEPQEVFESGQVLVEGKQNRTKTSGSTDKRKRWRRRHTERIIPLHDIELETKPQSEESVFVNPGVKMNAWADNALTKFRSGYITSEVTAYINKSKKDELDVKASVHSSLASPMNSPSFKCTKNVSVSALTSHFNEQLLQIDESNGNVVVVQSEQDDIMASLSGKSSSTSDYAEKEVYEQQARVPTPLGRSMSDSHVRHVKKIVSNIELRFKESHAEQENSEPSGSAAMTSSPSEPCLEMLEKLVLPPEISIVEREMNTNNNNNTSYGIKAQTSFEDSANSVEEEDTETSLAPATVSKSRSLTQSELQIIREVGKTFLGEMVLGDSDCTVPSSENPLLLSEENSNDATRHPGVKKRGIVRRMAKIIENRIKRQLQGKQEIQQHARSHVGEQTAASSKSDFAIKDSTVSQVQSHSVSMYEPLHVVVQESTDALNHENKETGTTQLVGDESSCEGTVARVSDSDGTREQNPQGHVGPNSSRVRDLLNLIGPTPYCPDRALTGVTRVQFRGKKTVRRSQSERSFGVHNKSHFSRYKSKRVPPGCQNSTENYANSLKKNEVKRMVRMMEEGPINAREKSNEHDRAKGQAGISCTGSKDDSLHFGSCIQLEMKNKYADSDDASYSKPSWIRRDNCLYQTI